MKEHGHNPSLMMAILKRAIAVLKEFLKILMEHDEAERTDDGILQDSSLHTGMNAGKGPRPDSQIEELEFRRINEIYQKLQKVNRKFYALQKERLSVKQVLDKTPEGLFHRKERKALQERIDGLDRQIEQVEKQFEAVPVQYGYKNVKEVKQALQSAKNALQDVRRKQAEWDGIELPVELKPQTQKQKESVLKKLAENQINISEQHHKQSRPKQMEI